jgi:hypothetical protein
LDMRAATLADGTTVRFTTFSSERTPLFQQTGGEVYTSGELRVRDSATGVFETDYLLLDGVTRLAYGSMTLTLPMTDSNGNGLPDFLELGRAVSLNVSGAVTMDQPAVATGTVTGTLTRAAGSARGDYRLAMVMGGVTRQVDGHFVLLTSFPDVSSAVYTRGSTNQLVMTFQMTDGEGQPGAFAQAATTFTVPNADTLSVAAFSFENSFDWVYQVEAGTFQRSGNRYRGTVRLADGSPDTPWVGLS